LSIPDNISAVYKRMSHAAMKAGRDPGEVKLVAVSKSVEVDLMKQALEAGVRTLGESRVQEAGAKASALQGWEVEWHMVGHLQRNKTKAAVALFDLIHSVDSLDLLHAVEKHASSAGKLQRALLQVNVSGEESKYGADVRGLEEMVRAAERLHHVRVEGLMTIAPFLEDPEEARPCFRRLKELNDSLGYPELSMGMTGDFEVAIEEGATMVRVGTAIFGERSYA
jgi:pyridoxal phosphate enzyme (YggS family)